MALGVAALVALFFFADWGDGNQIGVIVVNESQERMAIVRFHFPDQAQSVDRNLPLFEPVPYGETTSYGDVRDNYPQRVVVVGEGGVTLFDDVVGPEEPDDREFTIVVR